MSYSLEKVFHWSAVVAWLLLIFYFSSQPDLKSGFQPLYDFIARKIAHAAEYFVLAFLLYRTLRGYHLNATKSIIGAVIGAVIYAGTDEWHQSFVAGRTSSIIDVGVDTAGALLFAALQLNEKK